MKKLFCLCVFLIVLTLLCSCGGGNGPTNPISESEPNNTMETAQSIPTNGAEITGSIDPGTDSDFYKFTGEIGYGYSVRLTWVSGENLDLKGYWYAYDGNNFYILNDTGAKQNETDTIDFHTIGGVCYLRIVDALGSNLGQYKISVTKGSFGTANIAAQYKSL